MGLKVKCPKCGHEFIVERTTPKRHIHNWKIVGKARAIDWDDEKWHFLGPPRPVYKCDCGKYKWESFTNDRGRENITLPSRPLPQYIKAQVEGKELPKWLKESLKE